jgi:1,4-dihydroxy-2-naphthoate octaprenyltransferase
LTLPLFWLAIALAWSYSSPPLRLHNRGVGEVAATTIVAGLTPLIGCYLQAGEFPRQVWLSILPLLCLQFNMLLSVALSDREGDAAVGKRTLVVLLGRPATARLYLAILGVAYGMLPLLVAAGLPSLVGLAAMLNLPIAIWQARRIRRGAWLDPGQWGSVAFFTIVLLMSMGGLQLAAYGWLSLN